MTPPNADHILEGPRGAVVGVISAADRFLLVKRAKPPMQGKWALPGGKIEKGEAWEAAFRREIREECQIEVGPATVIGALDGIPPEGSRGGTHYVMLVIAADALSEHVIAGDDAAEARWYTLDEIAVLPDIINGNVVRMIHQKQRLLG